MIYEFNAETQEGILREMNDIELANHEFDIVRAAEEEELRLEEEAKLVAKAEAKKQALAALGLSQEVVNLLAE